MTSGYVPKCSAPSCVLARHLLCVCRAPCPVSFSKRSHNGVLSTLIWSCHFRFCPWGLMRPPLAAGLALLRTLVDINSFQEFTTWKALLWTGWETTSTGPTMAPRRPSALPGCRRRLRPGRPWLKERWLTHEPLWWTHWMGGCGGAVPEWTPGELDFFFCSHWMGVGGQGKKSQWRQISNSLVSCRMLLYHFVAFRN